MASLRDIRKHIKAVKNIKQITYAMKMVSSARIKKAQSQILSFKPYVNRLEEVIVSLKNEMLEDDINSTSLYRFFKREAKKSAIGLVIVSGDKGLCGSFNNQIINASLKFIKQNRDKKIYIITVGKKATDFFKKAKDAEVYYQMHNIFPKANYTHASLLTSKIIELYDTRHLDEIRLIYSEFKSMIRQEIKNVTLLPILNYIEKRATIQKFEDFCFEPDKKMLLENLIPKYINVEVLRMLLENQASELAARMNAMDLASKNAGELIEELTLKMNKLRQAQITTELNEIVSGANAIT